MGPEGAQGQDTEQRNQGKSWVNGFPRLYGRALLVYVEVNHSSSVSLSGYCGSVTPSIQTASQFNKAKSSTSSSVFFLLSITLSCDQRGECKLFFHQPLKNRKLL